MIRSLKWKFVFVMMAISALVLLLVFGGVYVMTTRSLYQNSVIVLSRALGEMNTAIVLPGSTLQETQYPYFTAIIKEDGSVTVPSGNYYSLNEETVIDLCSIAVNRTDGIGTIERFGVRYMKESGHDSLGNAVTRVAFVDITVERGTLAALLANSTLIALPCLSILFFISLVFATEAVRPLADSMEKQRRFVADASHELNTPLTVIISNIGLLMSEDAGDPRLERVMYEAKRMKKLTKDLLYLARSDGPDRSALVFSTLDLSELAEESALFFEPLIFEEGKSIRFEGDADVRVRGSESHIRQLIEILLDNARKYSYEQTEITLRIRKQAQRKRAVLTVNNQGDAIPPDKLSMIFERFYRADSARKENGGYGLGLSIAKSIVEQHSGSISVASSPSDGTTFTVVLPLAKGSD